MPQRGHCHTQATVAVARKLVERTWTVLDNAQPYQLRDPDGQPITARAANALIAEKYTVTPEVRAAPGRAASPPLGQTDPLTASAGATPTARRHGRARRTPPGPNRPPRSSLTAPNAGDEESSTWSARPAAIVRWPPRTNDVDLDEHRRIIGAPCPGSPTRSWRR
jgi:hypothetical protein